MGYFSGCSAIIELKGEKMYCFENIIDEIEKNITEDIDVNLLAKKINMSVYEFRRIFTFITKISFGEYIRKRRLSLAALDLMREYASVSGISAKYGYESPSSFSRAFKEFHGISPKDVLNGNRSFKILTRINTSLSVTGGKNISYEIIKKPAFKISGYMDSSDMTDTECCEKVWENFYNSSISEEIINSSAKLYAVYDNAEDSVNCLIGVLGDGYKDYITLPESEWACFKLRGTKDEYVNGFYNDILHQWFSSSEYVKNNEIPNIEIFPSDMSIDDFEWEILIPIRGIKNENNKDSGLRNRGRSRRNGCCISAY